MAARMSQQQMPPADSLLWAAVQVVDLLPAAMQVVMAARVLQQQMSPADFLLWAAVRCPPADPLGPRQTHQLPVVLPPE